MNGSTRVSCVSREVGVDLVDCVLYGSWPPAAVSRDPVRPLHRLLMSPTVTGMQFLVFALSVRLQTHRFIFQRGVEINPRIPVKLARAQFSCFVIGRVVK